MTATTSSIVQRKPSVWSTERKKGGSAPVDGSLEGDAAFENVTTVREALDVCSAAWKAEHVVTSSSIGKASSTLT